jgi:acyl-CoA thioester hydrolase
MIRHRTACRVIYGDTDNMGYAYYGNYFRWFEIGRNELFSFLGLTYKCVEDQGVFLPVAEAHCKYSQPARYDDLIVVETTLDLTVKAGLKFDYRVLSEDGRTLLARGYTTHACVNRQGKVVRPPAFLKQVIAEHLKGAGAGKPEG